MYMEENRTRQKVGTLIELHFLCKGKRNRINCGGKRNSLMYMQVNWANECKDFYIRNILCIKK